MTGRRQRAIAAILIGVVGTVVPSVTIAHTPIAGSDLYATDNQPLPRDFPGTYPSWVQSAAKNALDTNHSDPATNNSRSPVFAYTVGGAGDVWTRSISNSGSGNGTWNYRVHMNAEAGLDASNEPTFNATWTNSPVICALICRP